MLIILATQEAEIGRIEVKASPGKKFMRSHLNQQLDVVVCACHPGYVGIIEALQFRLAQAKSGTVSQK
jgi:hypothetical protein